MAKIQQEYIKWYTAEQAKGLKEVRFFPNSNRQATVENFILENFAIDKAIEEGSISPIPEYL